MSEELYKQQLVKIGMPGLALIPTRDWSDDMRAKMFKKVRAQQLEKLITELRFMRAKRVNTIPVARARKMETTPGALQAR